MSGPNNRAIVDHGMAIPKRRIESSLLEMSEGQARINVTVVARAGGDNERADVGRVLKASVVAMEAELERHFPTQGETGGREGSPSGHEPALS